MGVRQLYLDTLAERGYTADPAQLHAIDSLERCETEWADYKARRSNALIKLLSRPEIPRGVYMHGGVGRGKSFLMDCFFNAVPLTRKTRLHFHEFMREVHRELAELHGTVNPLHELGLRISRRYRLICTTSNFKPDDLYPNGLHRERILPAIELLKQKLEVISVDHGVDYRRLTLERLRLYHSPLDELAEAAMAEAFERVTEAKDESPLLRIEHRELRARRRAGGVVWFDFKQLCGGPRSQNDYLELATQFHTLLLSGVPQMSPRLASEARRFTWLVDVLYDRRVKLIMSAEVAPEMLYTEGPLAHEFPRTASRLNEMQSAHYLALARRIVDTTLT